MNSPLTHSFRERHMTENHSTGEIFNYEDLEERSRRYLEEVRREARGILETAVLRAEAEKDRIFEEAHRQGYAQGYDAGREKGIQVSAEELAGRIQAGVEHQLKSATDVLAKAAESLEETRMQWQSHWEKNALRMVCLIAGCIIRQEMQKTPNIQLNWIRDALELSAGGHITLRMNPEDLVSLRSSLDEMVKRMHNLGTVDFVTDETLENGDCELKTHFGEIDMRVASQLRRIMEEIS